MKNWAIILAYAALLSVAIVGSMGCTDERTPFAPSAVAPAAPVVVTDQAAPVLPPFPPFPPGVGGVFPVPPDEVTGDDLAPYLIFGR